MTGAMLPVLGRIQTQALYRRAAELKNLAEKHDARDPAEEEFNSPEENAAFIENQIKSLLKASSAARVSRPPDFELAAEKAKAAWKQEAFLHKYREKHGLSDHSISDTTNEPK